MSGQGILFAVIFVATSMEALGLRAMRALPLSTAGLASLLLSTPVALGLSGAVFTVLWFGVGDRSLPLIVNYAAQAIAIAGFSSLTIAVSLHIASSLRLLVLAVFVFMPSLAFRFLAKTPALLALLGLVALVGAFALLQRGLRKSSAFYQARRLFGLGVGQPMTPQ